MDTRSKYAYWSKDELEELKSQQLISYTTSNAVTMRDTPSPDIVSLDISPRMVAYHGNAVPGYLTIKLKTTVLTKGEIIVSGNAIQTKIILSDNEYKTDFNINWVPFNDEINQPLPPGQYSMKINLYKQNGGSSLGIPAGDFIVVHESNPLPVIDNIKINPVVITNIPEPEGVAMTINFRVNRHAEVYYELHNAWYQKYQSWPVKLEPGNYTWTWNGRASDGTPMENTEYSICFNGEELNYNNTYDGQFNNICSQRFIIQQNLQVIPESRFREIIKDINLRTASITPDGDGVEDKVEGTITLNEKANISLRLVDAVGNTMKELLPGAMREPGVYDFSWDGTDLFGSVGNNGAYYIMATLTENQKYGYYTFKDKYIRILNSKELKPRVPVQNVRIVPDYIWIGIRLGGRYLGIKGAVYPIIDFVPIQGWGTEYSVLLAEGVYGNVKVGDVEWLDLDKVPLKWGRVINAAAEIRRSPGTESGNPVLEYIPQGNTIRILNKEGDWYRVVLASGKQGYAKVADLTEVAAPGPIPPTPPTAIEHIVVSGDTLWKIAQTYGVSINDIMSANNLDPNAYLFIGQKLLIPKKTSPVPGAPAFPKVYYVLKGDTYWKISQAYGITLQDLYITNRIPAGSPLWVNQRLIIPGVYYVVAGDTLWKIAQKHKTTIDKILQINGLDVNKPLNIGQKILIGM